jgi:hypothetical protein
MLLLVKWHAPNMPMCCGEAEIKDELTAPDDATAERKAHYHAP